MSIVDVAASLVGASQNDIIAAANNEIASFAYGAGTDWCGIFVSLCIHRAASGAHDEWCSGLANDFKARAQRMGWWSSSPAGGGCTLITWDYEWNGTSNHVGIFESGNAGSPNTIEGNAVSLGASHVARGSGRGWGLEGFVNLPTEWFGGGGGGGGTAPVTPPATACEAFDFSGARPDPGLMAQSGIKLVMRYLGDPAEWPTKAVTRAEVDSYHAAGISVGFIYERTGTSWRGGFDAGVADATEAAQWLTDIGAPVGIGVAFALDSPDQNDALETAVDYIRGCGSVVEAAYAYCTASVADAIFDAGVERSGYSWQTYAWSGGVVSPHAALYQYSNGEVWNGQTVDFNDIRSNNPSWYWLPDGSLGASDGSLGIGGPGTPGALPSNPGDEVTPKPVFRTVIRRISDKELLVTTANNGRALFRMNLDGLWVPSSNVVLTATT